jgi:hypothetical protein
MKAERCQATAASGQPCAATPRPGRPYCLWHDPDAAEHRRELSRKGGRARSNQARAKKGLPAGVMTNDELRGLVGLTIKGVLAGRVEPGVGNCVANLSRSYIAITEAGELEERLQALERQAGINEKWRA